MGEDVEALKRGVPLLDYLQQHCWIGWPAGRGEYVGLCPLHEETRPSFYVNTRKDVFYCHGCGEGGDLLRFLQLSRRLSFPQGIACLDPQTGAEADATALLEQTAAFYQQQLNNYPEALGYLHQRGLHDLALIQELGIGYAPGGNLRRYLTTQGYSFALLRRVGLINAHGTDALYHISASSFLYAVVSTSSTSTAAASAPPSPIVSCPAARGDCMPGRRSATTRKSSWSRACSTMRCCGRRASPT